MDWPRSPPSGMGSGSATASGLASSRSARWSASPGDSRTGGSCSVPRRGTWLPWTETAEQLVVRPTTTDTVCDVMGGGDDERPGQRQQRDGGADEPGADDRLARNSDRQPWSPG